MEKPEKVKVLMEKDWKTRFDIPDIQTAFSQLREQNFYPFSERLAGLSAIIAFLSSVILASALVVETITGEIALDWKMYLTLTLGIAGAPWLILVPTAVLITAIGRSIGHVNKRGSELIPNWDSPVLPLVEHVLRVIGGILILYWFNENFLNQGPGDGLVTLALIIFLSSLVIFAVGLITSGIGGFFLFIRDKFENE